MSILMKATTNRGRPQDKLLRKRILRATLDIIGSHGIEGLTFELVAKTAGTSRPAIYRRWSKKEDLITEAINSDRPELTAPDTGSLRGDLLQAAREFTSYYSTPHARQAVLDILKTTNKDTEIAAAWAKRYGLPRIKNFETIFVRAVARSEINAHADIATMMYILSASLLQASLLGTLDKHLGSSAAITKVIDFVIAGAKFSP